MPSGFSGFQNQVITTTIKHALVHQGTIYYFTLNDLSLAAGGVLELLIRVGAERHMSLVGDFSGTLTFRGQLFEEPTINVLGTEVFPVNRNRSHKNLPMGSTFFDGTTTYTADGTEIDNLLAIGGKGSVGAATVDLDWELEPSTDYLLRVTNEGNQVSPVQVTLVMHDERANVHRFR